MTKEKKQSNPVGRPSELPQMTIKAREYLNGGYELVNEVIPTIAGLACYVGKNRDSIYQYKKESAEFSDILDGIMRLQESKLINQGLTGAFNSTITKLILTKHGYSDKVETDLKSSDNSMTPAPAVIISGKEVKDILIQLNDEC